jgi:O-antigen/teichoic acid export membrane protein
MKVMPVVRPHAAFAISSGALYGAKLVLDLVIASDLGPASYGVWTMLSIITTYSALATLGVLAGLGRELPYRMGSRGASDLNSLMKCGLQASLWSACVSIGGLSAFWILVSSHIYTLTTGIAVAIFALGNAALSYTQTILRAQLQFGLASAHQLSIAGCVLLVACAGPGLYSLEMPVALVGATYVATMVFGLRHIKFSTRMLLTIDWRSCNQLVRVGLPIVLVGLLFTAVITIDKWVVATAWGERELGLYSFGSLFLSGTIFLLSVYASQLFPELAKAYGQGGRSALSRERMSSYIVATAVGSLVITSALVMGAPYLIQTFWPTYIAAIEVAQVLALGGPFLGVGLLLSTYFNVLRESQHAVKASLISMSINLLLAAAAAVMDLGLAVVAAAATTSYIAYSYVLYLAFYRSFPRTEL